jgi:hypothetical protein
MSELTPALLKRMQMKPHADDPVADENGGDGGGVTWRERWPVHPAADVFPMLPDDELDRLAADIKANGLREKIVLYVDKGTPVPIGPALTEDVEGETFFSTEDVEGETYVLDGRNRLEALERAGIDPMYNDGRPSSDLFRWVDSWRCCGLYGGGGNKWEVVPGPDPVGLVISANIHRRHLTKRQQAALIVSATKAGGSETLANVAKVSQGARGPAKDPVKAKAVAEAAKHGISKRTVEDALADDRRQETDSQPAPKKPAPQKAPKAKRATGPTKGPGRNGGDPVAERELREWRERHGDRCRPALRTVFPEYVSAPSGVS